jgi:dCMP deaminase
MNILKLAKFADIAKAVSLLSKDPSTKVGAIVVDEDYNIRVAGYNGFPRGVNDDPERYANRDTKYKFISHAEENCISQAARIGVSLKDCALLVTSILPCAQCTKLIIQSGIKHIVCVYPAKETVLLRWRESNEVGSQMINEAGISIHIL